MLWGIYTGILSVPHFIHPFDFAYGLVGFSLLFLVQIILFRLLKICFGKIRYAIFWLFSIHLFLPLLGFFFTEVLGGTILLLSISLGFMLAFPAVTAKSPSLEILLLVDAHGEGGITREEILKRLAKPDLIGERLVDLANDGWIDKDLQKIRLKWMGKGAGWFFYYYRRLLRLPFKTG